MSVQSIGQVRADDTPARRSHNRKLALAYAQAGIPIFPSVGKVPVCLEWTRLDTSIDLIDRSEIIAKAAKRAEDNGREFDPETPIGATTDQKEIRRRWDKFPDAVPSISLGPAKLYVLDADIDDKRNGPQLVRQWLAEHNIDIATCPITQSQSGGEHIFFQAEGLRSHIGDTMKSLYVQVKSSGNQVVAPGAWRDDGKMYKAMKSHPTLVGAYLDKCLPFVPPALLALQSERSAATEAKSDDAIGAALEELRTSEADDFDTLVDFYDFERLSKKDEEFKQIWNEPGPDTSANRFTLAKCLHREFGKAFRVSDFATILGGYDGAGDYVGESAQRQHEYNNRNIARDFVASINSRKIVTGEAFGAIDEDEPEASALTTKAAADSKPKKTRLVSRNVDDVVAEYSPILWAVKHVLPLRSKGFLTARSHVGKTFSVIAMMGCMAQGSAFGTHHVDPEGYCVVYVTGEGIAGVSGRLKAWVQTNGSVFGRIQIISGISNPALNGHTALSQVKTEVDALVLRTGRPCGAIFIDTIASVCPGIREDESAAVGELTNFMESLAQATGATVVGVHHEGKDASRGARGSYAFFANADFALTLDSKGSPPQGKLKIQKQRDGARHEDIFFTMQTVVIGKDIDGDDVTSLVFKPSLGPTAALGDVSDQDDDGALELPNDGVADDRVAAALDTARRLPEGGFALKAIVDAFNEVHKKSDQLAPRTMSRAISILIDRNLLTAVGKGRSLRYHVEPRQSRP